MRTMIVTALCAVFMLAGSPALADDDRRGRGSAQWHHGHDGKHWYGKHRDGGKWDRDRGRHHRHADKRGHRHWKHGHWKHGHWKHGRPVVIWKGRRDRHDFRHEPVQRHYHKHYHRNSHDDWALYAILALQLVDTLNENQRQSYAWAQQQAVAVPIGESIQWHDSGLYGSVTPVREGSDGSGRYCREFQHEITVGNRLQSGYGVACRQPDGAWEIVS